MRRVEAEEGNREVEATHPEAAALSASLQEAAWRGND